jgi:ABC-type Fe3+-citrate transport system substrate-binding protein
VFEKLVSCMKLFPNYDLKRDLEELYLEKENSMVKKFMKSVKNKEVKVRNFNDFIKNREIEASDNILQELTFINPVSDTKLDLKDLFPMMI